MLSHGMRELKLAKRGCSSPIHADCRGHDKSTSANCEWRRTAITPFENYAF